MVQLKKNMRDDGTMLGIIATKKAFPAEHLSEPMYVQLETEQRKTFIVVKLEYAPLAYFALRQVAVHLFKTQQTLEIKDAETDEAVKTFNVVMAYINGPKFQQSINHTDRTIKDAQEARNCLTHENIYQHKYRQIDQIPEFYRGKPEPCEGSDMETEGVA